MRDVIAMETSVETSAAKSTTQQGRRLWWSIGVGGLLLVFVFGLLAWWPWYRQTQAIAAIERLGGFVGTEPVGPVWLRNVVGDEVMAGYDDVQAVSLFRRSHVTVAGLVHLEGLTNLQSLTHSLQFTDAGLSHLKRLTRLKRIDLARTQVTDAGLVHLKAMTKLESLSLSDTDVTDFGIRNLKGLTSLRALSLSYTYLTDAGLVHLVGLTNLETLSISGNQLTNIGVKRLQAALPGCKIMWTTW